MTGRSCFLITLVLVSLQACLGDAMKSSGQGGKIKSTIEGYLYFDHPGSYIQYSISNSKITALYDREGSGIEPEHGLLAARHFTPISIPNDYRTNEIIITDKYEDVVMYLPLTESVYSPIKFSPDGRFIAFKWWPKSYYDSSLKKGLAVFDMNGNKVNLFINPDHPKGVRYESFDWIDSESLVLAANDTLFEANVLNGNIQKIHELSDGSVVQDLDVDEEGQKIVLSIGDGEIDNHLYWSSLEKWDLHQLTNSNLNEINPVWSPDGTYVAFRYGYRAGYPTPPEYRACPEIYVAKVEPGRTYQLSATNNSEGLHVLEYTQDSGSVVTICGFSSLTWSDKPFEN